MKNLALVSVFVLAGCGGSPFTAGLEETDGGSPKADALTVATGGAPTTGSGGQATGGASEADGGGEPSSGGSGGSSGSGGSEVDGGHDASPPTTCKPGATRCQSATALQTCNASGSWDLATSCTGAYVGGLEYCCYMDSCDARAPSICAAIGCTLITHANGIGQTWQDCVPLGTYNKDQAMKACKASATTCIVNTRCGVGEVQGFNTDLAQPIGEWGYEDFAAGYVSIDYNLCSPQDVGRRQWH